MRRLWTALVAVAVLAAAGCTGTAATVGTAGLGDPYFPAAGNRGYQVEHYHLQVRYDPGSKELTGTATLAAVATAELAEFSLDLHGLTVESAMVDAASAAVSGGAGKLVLRPPEPLRDGARFTVVVRYAGTPEPVVSPSLGSDGFYLTDDGAFAAGQPFSASSWYPVNDHPLDKATYEVEVTAPQGLVAVSNGVPEGSTPSGGWVTWRWAERTPMASYLTVLAIGDYRLSETEHQGRPLVTAVHADLPTGVDEQLRRSGEIADVLAGWFGPYPFEAYGGIAVADQRMGFALETQSRPIYGPGFFADGRDGTGVIVHETAHQWFGNSVSVEGWNEIWLNEGFATYAEWLYEEHEGGDTAQETFDTYWEGPGAEAQFWTTAPGDPGPAQLFSGAVYVRGAMTLHALRRTVGDHAFFEILWEWSTRHASGNVTTADLVALAEQIAGRSLADLFDQWLYRTDRPPYPTG